MKTENGVMEGWSNGMLPDERRVPQHSIAQALRHSFGRP